jgi:hypothetical protein
MRKAESRVKLHECSHTVIPAEAGIHPRRRGWAELLSPLPSTGEGAPGRLMQHQDLPPLMWERASACPVLDTGVRVFLGGSWGSDGLCLDERGLRVIELVLRYAEVPNDCPDGSSFEVLASPVWDGCPGMGGRVHPDFVVASALPVESTAESPQLARAPYRSHRYQELIRYF